MIPERKHEITGKITGTDDASPLASSIPDTPEYILAHEIAGYAEPRLNNSEDRPIVNAIEIENTIRRETNQKERKEDSNHVQ